MSHRSLICGDITSLLVAAEDPDDEWPEWRPIAADVPREDLRKLYAFVPGPLPPLYEMLITSFRWARVDVGPLRLLANLPPSLDGLLEGITLDQGLFQTLVPAGFVQFGNASDVNYDPVCFDLQQRQADGDCAVVQFDHEEILCNGRLKKVEDLAPSFRALVTRIVHDADKGDTPG